MNNKILLLIPILIFLVPSLSYAEIGFNFDRIELEPNTFEWASHYDRIWDGSQWVNYILTNDNDKLRYESSGLTFEFDKNNCEFKLYDPKTNSLVISNYKFNLNIDNIQEPILSCDITSLIQTLDEIDFTIDNGKFQTNYVLTENKKVEWTHTLTNLIGLISITEVCEKCDLKEIVKREDQDIFNFGSYILDPKNDIHGTLKDVKQIDGDFITSYEKELLTNEEVLIIDPTFGYTDSAFDFRIYDVDSTTNGNPCAVTSFANATGSNFVGTDSTNNCFRTFIQWDVTSIPDNVDVTNVNFRYDITVESGTMTDCDYRQIANELSGQTREQNWDQAITGTVYVNNDATCNAVGNNYVEDLGTSADSNLETSLVAAKNWWAIAITEGDNLNINPGATTGVYFDGGNELEVTYDLITANAPANFVAYAYHNTKIQLSWNTPTLCYSGCTGYKIWRESPTGGGFSVLVSNTSSTATTYQNTGLIKNTQYNYKVAAWNHAGLGANSTAAADTTWNNATFNINTLTELNIDNIGDEARISGSLIVSNSSWSNLTSIKFYVNGTLTNTNGTNQNKTTQYQLQTTNYGPFWYQMTTDSIYNFTIVPTVTNETMTLSQHGDNLTSREYEPDYFTADDPTQGTVNYTFVPTNTIQVNRNQSGAVFSIECAYITQSNAFFNNTELQEWDNETNTGFYSNDYTGFYYVTCYNDGELFTTILEQNYTNQLVPGLVIFDELGGFMGAPSVILVIIAILSLATGRNFPIVIIIAVSVTGIMGAMGLVTFDPSIWAALIIIAGITLFGVRKFY